MKVQTLVLLAGAALNGAQAFLLPKGHEAGKHSSHSPSPSPSPMSDANPAHHEMVMAAKLPIGKHQKVDKNSTEFVVRKNIGYSHPPSDEKDTDPYDPTTAVDVPRDETEPRDPKQDESAPASGEDELFPPADEDESADPVEEDGNHNGAVFFEAEPVDPVEEDVNHNGAVFSEDDSVAPGQAEILAAEAGKKAKKTTSVRATATAGTHTHLKALATTYTRSDEPEDVTTESFRPRIVHTTTNTSHHHHHHHHHAPATTKAHHHNQTTLAATETHHHHNHTTYAATETRHHNLTTDAATETLFHLTPTAEPVEAKVTSTATTDDMNGLLPEATHKKSTRHHSHTAELLEAKVTSTATTDDMNGLLPEATHKKSTRHHSFAAELLKAKVTSTASSHHVDGLLPEATRTGNNPASIGHGIHNVPILCDAPPCQPGKPIPSTSSTSTTSLVNPNPSRKTKAGKHRKESPGKHRKESPKYELITTTTESLLWAREARQVDPAQTVQYPTMTPLAGDLDLDDEPAVTPEALAVAVSRPGNNGTCHSGVCPTAAPVSAGVETAAGPAMALVAVIAVGIFLL
ncbi:hypothetical protein E4U41_006519 [Claviceps citrina]|nr:hypothetical protein E4U41_006519 [Claviceps citrina]